MCHGSAKVRQQVPVEVGTTYRVMNIADASARPGRARPIAALAPPGSIYRRKDANLSCAACFLTRVPVSVRNVPKSLRIAYDLPASIERAWLVPGGSDEDTDYVYVKGFAPFDFALFIDEAVRITALPADATESLAKEAPVGNAAYARELAMA